MARRVAPLSKSKLDHEFDGTDSCIVLPAKPHSFPGADILSNIFLRLEAAQTPCCKTLRLDMINSNHPLLYVFQIFQQHVCHIPYTQKKQTNGSLSIHQSLNEKSGPMVRCQCINEPVKKSGPMVRYTGSMNDLNSNGAFWILQRPKTCLK